ncbi:MAG: hypothetical protein QG657_4671, partial [Acidobacteriota bacterium]|nr:hypothetical protein [Acidobacteriota bacterium]
SDLVLRKNPGSPRNISGTPRMCSDKPGRSSVRFRLISVQLPKNIGWQRKDSDFHQGTDLRQDENFFACYLIAS